MTAGLPNDGRRAIACRALIGIVVIGFLVRCAMAFLSRGGMESYELFQEYEQGHRLAFGSGVVPFEFIFGYRSWLVPGFIAGVMKLCSWFSSDPRLYLAALRLIAISISLSAIAAAYLLALRAAGSVWAVVTALLCALWYQTVAFAPSLDPGILASYVTLFAIYLAQTETDEGSFAAGAWVGALLALAFYVRLQLFPALVLIACWYGRTAWRARWLPMAVSAVCVLVPLGLLDYATWGSPFQSLWLNFHMNVNEGIAGHFGSPPASYYLQHLIASPRWFLVSILFGSFALLGAWRSPLLGLCVAAVLISHALVPHKEQRFIVFALISIPILMGIGLAAIAGMIEARADRTTATWSGAVLVLVVLLGSVVGLRSAMLARYNGGLLNAFLAAREDRQLCGLAVADYHLFLTGGYTYLHRSVPIYFVSNLTRTSVPGYYATKGFPELALANRFVLDGHSFSQFSQDQMAANTRAFNLLIANAGRALPGYRLERCFPDGRSYLPEACLLKRPGPCA